jgi:hypothetical protein
MNDLFPAKPPANEALAGPCCFIVKVGAGSEFSVVVMKDTKTAYGKVDLLTLILNDKQLRWGATRLDRLYSTRNEAACKSSGRSSASG